MNFQQLRITVRLLEAVRKIPADRPLRPSAFGIDIDRSPKPARPDGALRLGYIGPLSPHKDVHLLLQAFLDDPTLAGRMSAKTDYDRTSRMMVEDLIRLYARHRRLEVPQREEVSSFEPEAQRAVLEAPRA